MTCEAPGGCVKSIYVKKHRLCAGHYQRQRKGRDMSAPLRRANGTGTIDGKGYVRVHMPSHPRAMCTGAVFQHVVVMEQVLGRPLLHHENVHHINGRRDDNRPENLELWSTSQPSGQRVADKVAWARELLAIYEGTVGV